MTQQLLNRTDGRGAGVSSAIAALAQRSICAARWHFFAKPRLEVCTLGDWSALHLGVFLPQEAKPFIVEIIRPPTEETTVVDVLVGSLGLAGAFAVAAVPLGLIAGFLLIRWNKRRRPESAHMPHISPSMQLLSTESPDPGTDGDRRPAP